MLPLLLLLAAADPSPSLQAIVALGRGPIATAPAPAVVDAPADGAVVTEAEPAKAAATTATTTPTATTATKEAPTTTPLRPLTKAEEPSPLAGVAALVALGGAAAGLWWKKRARPGAARLLQLQESVAVGKGRALIVADVDGRRILLSSSEAGVSLLLDLGRAPAAAPAPVAVHDDDDAFARALEKETAPVTVSSAVGAAGTVDVEGHEIQRRLEKARRAA